MSAEPITALTRLLPDYADDAVQLLDETGLGKFAMYASGISAAVRDARTLATKPLETDEDEARAVELVSQVGIALKELDSLRDSCVRPLNDQVKSINKLFRVLTDPAEAQCGKGGALDKVILVWRAQKRARIQREQEEARRRQEEAARKETEALAAAEAANGAEERRAAMAAAEAASREQSEAAIYMPRDMTRGVRTDSGLVSESERYVLQGVHNLDQVPKQYWRHEKVIEALKKVLATAVRAGEREIPGCSIGLEAGLTRRPGF